MGEFSLPLRSDNPAMAGEKWDECCLCGPRRIRAIVHFDSGSVSPTTNEVVTGATSGDTMVLANKVLISGTYAGGDAVGILEGSSPTGYDSIGLEIFQDNENLNGATSGANFATVNKTGAISISGRLIPESELVEYNGKKYCRSHFQFKFRNEWRDDERIESSEDDRQ